MHTPLVANRYELVLVAGQGGMGTVYRARDRQTETTVALKLLRTDAGYVEELRRRFLREISHLRGLDHPHIVPMLDCGIAAELDHAPYFVMPWLEGEDLSQRLARLGPLPPQDVVRWLSAAGGALAHAHERGLVHRDIKPSNLFLSRQEASEHIFLVDFGIVKNVRDDLSTLTGENAIIGTPRYLAPEQTVGRGRGIVPQTDQWAMGLVAFELLSGRPYFDSTDPSDLLRQVLFGRVVAPSERGLSLGMDFDEWFLRSCAPRSDARFESAEAQAHALEEAIGNRDAATIAVAYTSSPPDPCAPTERVVRPQKGDSAPSPPPESRTAQPHIQGRWSRGATLIAGGTLGTALAAIALAVVALYPSGPRAALSIDEAVDARGERARQAPDPEMDGGSEETVRALPDGASRWARVDQAAEAGRTDASGPLADAGAIDATAVDASALRCRPGPTEVSARLITYHQAPPQSEERSAAEALAPSLAQRVAPCWVRASQARCALDNQALPVIVDAQINMDGQVAFLRPSGGPSGVDGFSACVQNALNRGVRIAKTSPYRASVVYRFSPAGVVIEP